MKPCESDRAVQGRLEAVKRELHAKSAECVRLINLQGETAKARDALRARLDRIEAMTKEYPGMKLENLFMAMDDPLEFFGS